MYEFFKRYFELIQGPLKGLNLTAIQDYDEFYVKQVLDSLLPINDDDLKVVLQDHLQVIDVGTGGGFPLLPLAKQYPEKHFIGIDSRKKKIDALKYIVQDLKLENVSLINERVENILIDNKSLITFKAVGGVRDLLQKINATQETDVFFYKGPNWREKEDVVVRGLPKGWKLFSEKEFSLETTVGRAILHYRSQDVPRRTDYKDSLIKISLKKI